MKKILFLIIVGGVGTVLAATSVPADALTFGLDFVFSGTAPLGERPWLTATFTDVDTDQVELTLAAPGLTGKEFVSEWYFNFDPTVISLGFPDVLAGIDYEMGTGIGRNYYKAGGESGMFDIRFIFETSNNLNDFDERFTAGQTAVYKFTGTGLTAESFNFLNEPGNFYSAAHVQGIGENDDSGWIAYNSAVPIPEPATILLIGAGLVSLLGIRRKKIIQST